MHLLLRASLAFCLALSAAGIIAAADATTSAAATAATASTAKAVNTICPNEGDPVDPKIAPVTVTTKAGTTVVIGVCCDQCPAVIAKDPDKFAAAALKNEKAK